MYRDTELQKTIGQWTASAFLGGAALFFLVFLAQASTLSAITTSTQRIVGLGPLQLIKITKSVSPASTSASFELLSGIIWYIVILVAIAAAGAWVSSRRNTTTS